MLGLSEPPAGGSPVQEPVNQKPTSSMFIECLSTIVSHYIGSLLSHSLTVEERGENFADS